MHRAIAILTLALVLLTSFCLGEESDNWTRFRGPNGSGVSEATTIPVKWSEQDYNWVVEIPGEGHSSPIVWGEKIFVTSAETKPGLRYLLSYEVATGKLLWQKTFPLKSYKKHNNNSFATSTPCCDAQHVYVLWQAPGETCSLWAIDHAGQEVWQADVGKFKGGHGPAVSPIVYQDMVIVANDLDANSSLMAFDAASGKLRWQTPRESQRTSYSTPCVFQGKSRPPELIFTEVHHGITGVDPQTGHVNWEVSVFGTFKQRAIASPVVTDKLVIGSSGFTTAEKNVVAVKPSLQANGTVAAQEVYRVSKSVPHLPTPLVYQDRLFLWTDRGGIVTSVNVRTGEQVWQKRIGGNFSGSPVCIGGKLYCADDDGQVYVVSTSDQYELLAENSLSGPTRATPAVAAGRMYFRTYSQLLSLGGK